MSLSDFYDGKFLTAGWHDVIVQSYKMFQCNSGSQGVEFTVKSMQGGTSRISFVIHPNSLWKLAQFADAAGISKEAAKAYDPFNSASHRALVNRKLRVQVTKGEKYHEVTDWEKIGSQQDSVPPIQHPSTVDQYTPSQEHVDGYADSPDNFAGNDDPPF